MDAAKLKEYRYLKREIKSLQKRIDHLNSTLRNVCVRPTASFPIKRYIFELRGRPEEKQLGANSTEAIGCVCR